MQKKMFFFLLWSVSVCLSLTVIGGVIFFERIFPIWYVLPLFMVSFPFSLTLIADKEEYFLAEQKGGYFGWKLFFSLVLIGVITFFVKEASIDIFFLFWLIIGLFFGFAGKLSFWGALCLLFSTVGALLLDQQVYAEQFSVFLYYLLCIGVCCELIGLSFSLYLEKGLAGIDGLARKAVKALPVSVYHIWKEYGKEMLLILYMACMGYVFFLQLFSFQSLQVFFLLLCFFLLVLRVAGKEGRNFLASILGSLTLWGSVLIFLLWGWSFVMVDFVLPYRELCLFVRMLGVLVDWFWGKRIFQLANWFSSSARELPFAWTLGFWAILLLLSVAYFAGWKVGILIFVIAVLFVFLIKMEDWNVSDFFKSLFQ